LLEAREWSLSERSAELDGRAAEVDRIRTEAAEKGWNDAKELISATRRRMNSLLDDLKREKRSDIAEEIRKSETELLTQLRPPAEQQERALVTTVVPGDTVHIGSLGYDGIVVSYDARHAKVRVRAGRMEIDVPAVDLFVSRGGEGRVKKKQVPAPWKADVVESDQRELKLIGMRVDAALSELEPFINHAAAAGLREVRIIHGVGSGRLRDAVREELERHPLVEGFRPGEPHEGRDGATVVTIRN
jgi:DNA mismatch repair protein MutS2